MAHPFRPGALGPAQEQLAHIGEDRASQARRGDDEYWWILRSSKAASGARDRRDGQV